MKNTKYVTPVLEYVEMDLADVIRTSGEDYGLSMGYGDGIKLEDK